MPAISKIRPFLWFPQGAKEAAEFYCSVFPDSRVDSVWTLDADSPSGPPGTVEVADGAGTPAGPVAIGGGILFTASGDPLRRGTGRPSLREDRYEE